MISKLACIAAAACVLAASLAGVPRDALGHDPKSSPLEQGAPRKLIHLPVKDFSLTDHEGRRFGFEQVRGKLVIVSFIYTSCPDICPLITSNILQVQKSLTPDEKAAVRFLSITTDPEIDGPGVLKAYGERYGVDLATWSFLTGTRRALAPVWKAFGVKVERKARGLINHTSLTSLIDGEGVMRFAYYGASPDPQRILEDLRALLARRSIGGGAGHLPPAPPA